MELFTKGDSFKLCSHLDKYLVADDDQKTVRQSRNGDSRRAVWTVEIVDDQRPLIRLRSCHDTYLTASYTPFLLGMTGDKVTQTPSSDSSPMAMVAMDWQTQWEPVRDGFQVKLKSWCGKWLRANGGSPPWRNSVTHDQPHTSKTKEWVLWDIIVANVGEEHETMSFGEESFTSSHPDVSDLESPAPVGSMKSFGRRLSFGFPFNPKTSFDTKYVSAMEFFQKAKAVRIRSVHDKYLTAEEDEETVVQGKNGSSENARWIVEPVDASYAVIRLRNFYGKYLTASNERFLLGATGRKVVQSMPSRLDSSVEWEPLREGSKIKLRTRQGKYLRANGGVPPYRNSVTHDSPFRASSHEWTLWDIDVIEILLTKPPPTAPPQTPPLLAESDHFSEEQSNEPPPGPRSEGKAIYYHIADEKGHVEDESTVGYAFTFKGNSVEELTQALREETSIEDITVCTQSPLNGKLFPLTLKLPPTSSMHVVLVPGVHTV